MSPPEGCQKNHDDPLYAQPPPMGRQHGRISLLERGTGRYQASQLIHISVRGVAEAYHASRIEGDNMCQIIFIFFPSTVCCFLKLPDECPVPDRYCLTAYTDPAVIPNPHAERNPAAGCLIGKKFRFMQPFFSEGANTAVC
jgi:hypothetical protein